MRIHRPPNLPADACGAVSVAALLLVLAFTQPALASACAGAKLEASGAYADALLQCRALEPRAANESANACTRNARRALARAFADAERLGNCTATQDLRLQRDALDRGVDAIVAGVGSPASSICAAQKLKAAGAHTASLMSCQANAALLGTGYGVTPSCRNKSNAHYEAAFARAERKADCAATTPTLPVLDALVRGVVGASRATLWAPVARCSSIRETAWHGPAERFGNGRVSKIVRDKVACVNADNGAVAECVFKDSLGSGTWMESEEGNFALAGQSISLDGRPGATYTVASRVSDAAPARCLEPIAMDTAGRIASGTELLLVCRVEEVLSPFNTIDITHEHGFPELLEYPLRNFATAEVCSSDEFHPEGESVVAVRSYAQGGSSVDNTFCYTGYGAALNDINGMERGEDGDYLIGEGACRVIWNSGYEVPGAKRPATRSLPAPGSVNTRTPILWRPVNNNVPIANP